MRLFIAQQIGERATDIQGFGFIDRYVVDAAIRAAAAAVQPAGMYLREAGRLPVDFIVETGKGLKNFRVFGSFWGHGKIAMKKCTGARRAVPA